MARTRKGDHREWLRRAGMLAGVIVVLYYLFGGGEYGTMDLIQQRARYRKLSEEVSALEARADSLREEYRLITTDRGRLEEIAREDYGMVKGDKEIIYYLIPDSTSSRK